MTDDAQADPTADAGDAGTADGPDTLVGEGVDRREDAALLTGDATFTDDIDHPDLAYLTFARSEAAHADIEAVDTAAAESTEGVLAVYTWDDIAASDVPGVLPISTHGLDCDPPGHPVLARDRVRYQGQPIAAVVADDRYRARDAADAVEVTADSRPAVVDQREARAEAAPTLYEDAPDNVAATSELGDREATDDALADADHTVERDLTNNRLIPTALEPRAAVARWDAGDERLTVELTSQSPHGHRGKLSTTLGLPESAIRVVAPSVGGGFGHKGHHHPGEAAAAFAAMDLAVPVKWTATRGENYLAGAHGRDHRTTAELGVDDDGTIRGLAVETDANVGAYGLGGSLGMPGWYGSLLSSQYAIPAIHCETRAVFTNTAPIHSYRGAGRPEANYVAERLVDAAARELGVDPAELRRRNQIAEFPHETAVGATYDSGDYGRGLDEALDAAGWADLRDRPDRDDDGRYLGVGLACYVESTGGGMESGVVRAHPDGTVTVSAGTHSHGQGHATTYAQIVADELGVDYDAIDVREGDSDAIPQGTGTFGSRSTITGGNAVAESARAVRETARELAANLLDAPESAVEYRDGTFSAPDHTAETRAFADVAEAAYGWGVPEGMDPGLEATTFFEQDETAYTFGTHVVSVAVDPETGAVDIERYVALDDCGERVNPTIVEGQIEGGVAQGIGQARYEAAVYADDGSLETDSMLDYAVPRSFHVPDIETEATVTPSPTNDLGVKGIGEAGTIAAPPAVVNAVCDALAPLGIDHVDMPLTGERVRSAVRDARE
ncbi:carbon-monoxide dehydrogenase (acceptor) [Halosimplex carlsbadense 2-9-1]|uniref:Carbon-monoxide dehydrogenase (Acceptor) n=1 Tax=Halosimplex carlsbadense 2-9-1 TaxID=797114 RepID=M0D468_9EURY|nr:xanthine dehydrogenase family protein molybdopterin-binding subunit [Halosimplex carlsbadense]ELZ29472.1 carbon-monoxide dehydrogenase (acceptor) [Halosimplex carlsbadense 2-9-1]